MYCTPLSFSGGECQYHTGEGLLMALILCPKCNKTVNALSKSCRKCGYVFEEWKEVFEMCAGKIENPDFKGIYRYTLLGKKEQVYCPRCGSDNCLHYHAERVIPDKTKTKYTFNLNPFKPFTILNKKEREVRRDSVVTVSKFACNICGKLFY